ncbi:hypothetical protein COW81_00735 [Candidatus Campbellbacteria bacterium CG22_combo_CG10-13_8_21_14_all_36_13]|uniref:Polysaccharide pyruvyl transferase domain-containing protein n=1 Tax=Candidatus Campbellbacteria bacterium CG22_combo_CG10-13_8_21_14_all_36_13 TaxID=1974529 RepID=A0A2H0DYV1_9BACT|nr:MAG: hypothetical protein COW81_00735 [Candidatus Campbellbacteria bacterium CG22_combo_CG10-13_8_21_14_all_36_13]
MKYLYGLLKYSTNNIGDEIQSLVARQFLPRVDILLDRDKLNKVRSKQKIKVIMNGWFTHLPENWPPSEAIEPLFISFHITPSAIKIMTTEKSLAYLKKHAPIGCRDLYTQNILRSHSIDTYFSGCLTLTFHKNRDKVAKHIFVVDLEKNDLSELPTTMIKDATYTNHYSILPITGSVTLFLSKLLRRYYFLTDKLKTESLLKIFIKKIELWFCGIFSNNFKFNKASEVLDLYKNASLVITSRLHCALPCVAFGTPVIFLSRNIENVRFKEYMEYFITKSDIASVSDIDNFIKNKMIKNDQSLYQIKQTLIQKCRQFIASQ